MSSILKALKKVEHEKSSRFPNLLNIDSEILKSTESRRSISPFIRLLLLLLVFGGGAAATYFFMKKAKAPETTKSQPGSPAIIVLTPPQQTIKAEIMPDEIVVPALREPPKEALQKKMQMSAVVIKTPKTIAENM